jgi:flagellar biosynthetic protein FliR
LNFSPPVFDLTTVYWFSIIFLRAASFIFTAPIIGSRNVPVMVKAGLSLATAVVVYPVIPHQQLGPVPQNLATLSLIVVRESIIGMAIGYGARLVFDGVQFGAQYVAFMMGLGIANVLDPQSEAQIPLIAQLEGVIAFILFIAIGGHLWFISAFSNSYHILPTGGFKLISGTWVLYITKMVGRLFVIAMKVNAPIWAALLFTQVCMGIMARMIPQINIFIVGFPLQIAVGFFVLAFSLNVLATVLERYFYQMQKDIFIIMRLMAG